MTNFNSTFDSFRNYISLAVLLDEGFLEGAIRRDVRELSSLIFLLYDMGLVIPSFVERFKTVILS